MTHPRRLASSGQALVETVLTIPLLFLLAAGTFQFTQLFLARVRFEHACGVVLRQWSAGVRRDSTIENGIWVALEGDRRLFDRDSLVVTTGRSPRPTASAIPPGTEALPDASKWVREGFPFVTRWEVRIRCRPAPLFSRFLRGGLPFTTRLAVIPGRPAPGFKR